MKETTKQNLLFASVIGALFSIVFVVAITIAGELFPGLKDWLKAFSGHHWVSKSILSMLVYGGSFLFVFFSQKNISPAALRQGLLFLAAATILGSIIILGFYAWHYLAA